MCTAALFIIARNGGRGGSHPLRREEEGSWRDGLCAGGTGREQCLVCKLINQKKRVLKVSVSHLHFPLFLLVALLSSFKEHNTNETMTK